MNRMQNQMFAIKIKFSLGLFHMSNFKDLKKKLNKMMKKLGEIIYFDTRLKALECGRLGVKPYTSVGA